MMDMIDDSPCLVSTILFFGSLTPGEAMWLRTSEHLLLIVDVSLLWLLEIFNDYQPTKIHGPPSW